MLNKTFNKIYDTDIGYSFFNSKIAMISSAVLFIIFLCSIFAGVVSPYNPFDPASVSLMDAFTPPSWSEGGSPSFILGTDQQGRDMFSTIIYGSRISLIVGFASILFAMILGVFLGVTAGYIGGRYEIISCELQMSSSQFQASSWHYSLTVSRNQLFHNRCIVKWQFMY